MARPGLRRYRARNVESGAAGLDELGLGAATLAQLWQHSTRDVTDQYDQTELALRRVQWAGQLLKDLRGLASLKWQGQEARLVSSFRVDPTSFKLERQRFVGDETGRTVTAYPLTEAHRELFESLIAQPLSYRELSARLGQLKGPGNPLQIISRFVEEGLLQGYDDAGRSGPVRTALRFGGVGADDDIS